MTVPTLTRRDIYSLAKSVYLSLRDTAIFREPQSRSPHRWP